MLTLLLALALTAPFVTAPPMPPGAQELRRPDAGLEQRIAEVQKLADVVRARGPADVAKQADDPITRKARAANCGRRPSRWARPLKSCRSQEALRRWASARSRPSTTRRPPRGRPRRAGRVSAVRLKCFVIPPRRPTP